MAWAGQSRPDLVNFIQLGFNAGMAFFRIREAAEKIGVLPHVLRFWESQFSHLKAPKSTRGQRVYSDEDIEKLLKVKYLLYTEGYSISGAKKFLKEERRAPNEEPRDFKDLVENSLLRDLRRELTGLQEALKEL